MGSLSHPIMVSFCCKKKKIKIAMAIKLKLSILNAYVTFYRVCASSPVWRYWKIIILAQNFLKLPQKKFVMIVYFIVYCVNIMSHLQPLWALLICSSDACSAALRSRKEQRRYKVRQRKSHFSQCLISQETGSSCLPFSETAHICYELNFQDTRCLSVIEKKEDSRKLREINILVRYL